MSNGLLALCAFSPILLAAILLIGLRWPARRAMPVVFLLTAGIALFVWDMSFNRVLASTLQGLVITAGVLWIIFGAILLLNALKHSGGITAIRAGFATISPDRRIQAIINQARTLMTGVNLDDRYDEWVGSRPVTPDGLPLVGATRAPGVYVAGGHGMWGVVLGPATGKLLAERIVQKLLLIADDFAELIHHLHHLLALLALHAGHLARLQLLE